MTEGLDRNRDLRKDYGVLTPRRLVMWIGGLVLISAAAASALGFVGARQGVSIHHFDWSLAAVAGTAVGTVLLAGFTGALAWTTSGDVRATIRLADATQEDQRARDRPIVAVTLVGIREQMLDPTARKTVPVLDLFIKNVGLGPALDLRLRASYGGRQAPTEEVIAVVEVGQEIVDRPISLAGVAEPAGGFLWRSFTVSGECNDRTRLGNHDIVILAEAGLPDQLRAARDESMRRAWLELTTGLHEAARGKEVQYQSAVLNNGPADAVDVRLQLVEDSGSDYGQPLIVGTIRAPGQTNVTVTCPFPHGRLSCRLTWRDGRGIQSKFIDGAYQPLGLTLPPA
jgi:hypothetical protein